ncbi:PEP-CTERM/exosortase system-associated acyltransferase [Methylomonas sp. EFPC3]|uniref:PEP-CTERM/exosortase system-associated acyltransferase n=1 Tax=Methylomonas sp. EFPC3 TaxID=3021710 RepID=UPI0024171711|nr:PEP-CTERM/exosortase system-associated acyltransferase [Methylomonas sp. EFPC3]WFP50542.1 PEP-CTERM/exosortase system-associated acyltransferase [Methylomonas sp. EFPC3]
MISEKHSFDNCFEVFLADTPESKRIHYHLRYQVYCDELGYEDKELFPQQLEFDDWDQHAVHFIVRHRFTGQWLGALRVVSPQGQTFPFAEKYEQDQPLADAHHRDSIEISRLCVLREARRFAPRSQAAVDTDPASNVKYLNTLRQQSRSIMWGLYRAAVDYSAENGIKHWFILVAPALAYAVKKQGFDMRQVAEPCEHRGLRTPYMLDVDHILQNPLWDEDYQIGYRLYSELEQGEFAVRQRA